MLLQFRVPTEALQPPSTSGSPAHHGEDEGTVRHVEFSYPDLAFMDACRVESVERHMPCNHTYTFVCKFLLGCSYIVYIVA